MYFYLFCLHWASTAARASSVVLSRGHSLAVALSFSLQWLLSLQSVSSSVHGLRQLQRVSSGVTVPGFQSTGSVVVEARAQLLHRVWNLPRSGVEPVSPELAGRFLTAGPPGQSCPKLLLRAQIIQVWFMQERCCRILIRDQTLRETPWFFIQKLTNDSTFQIMT